ncbi:MAG TPA: tannase/feruloyl esterase family alpha/beta hydrolase [Terracidiphilus sp.]|nr:tannase/feruloyl esterase family alpha/beta hydrolase [Terracidiphilus sp.]
MLHASGPLVEPASTNLTTFSGDGGRLIFFHGDRDPWFSPLETLNYYKSLEATNGGAAEMEKWSRFFLVPGMSHCGGGPSLDHFDMLTAVVNWVEKGIAPDSVIATGRPIPAAVERFAPIRNTPSTWGMGTRKTQAILAANESPS